MRRGCCDFWCELPQSLFGIPVSCLVPTGLMLWQTNLSACGRSGWWLCSTPTPAIWFNRVLFQFIITRFEKVCMWITCFMCSSQTTFLGLSVLSGLLPLLVLACESNLFLGCWRPMSKLYSHSTILLYWDVSGMSCHRRVLIDDSSWRVRLLKLLFWLLKLAANTYFS